MFATARATAGKDGEWELERPLANLTLLAQRSTLASTPSPHEAARSHANNVIDWHLIVLGWTGRSESAAFRMCDFRPCRRWCKVPRLLCWFLLKQMNDNHVSMLDLPDVVLNMAIDKTAQTPIRELPWRWVPPSEKEIRINNPLRELLHYCKV